MRRKAFLRKRFKNWHSQGKSGTPPWIAKWGSKNKKMMGFISRQDQKGSRAIMRKKGMI